MVVTELAETSVAYLLGEGAAMSVIPIAGVVLLIVGLRRRPRGPQQPPPHPPLEPSPYPSGPPDAPELPQYCPTPPSSRSSTALIIVGLLLLAGGLFGVASRAAQELFSPKLVTGRSPGVGQCIGPYNFHEHAKSPIAQDCAKPDSIFEVVSTGGESATCPDGRSENSDYAFLRDGSTTLCFILNFAQGRCYTAGGDPHDLLFAVTACDDIGPRFKVVRRVDGHSGAQSCPVGTKAISYRSPPRLFCLQPLEQ